MSQVFAEDAGSRQHRRLIQRLLATGSGLVRVASAYVTDTDILCSIKNQRVQLLTSLLRMDVVSGATSLKSLRYLIESGVECRCLSHGPRLHAKVYMADNESAVVTSANLTATGLDRNIEVGALLTGSEVQNLARWFTRLWATAQPLDLAQIAQWQQETAELRRKYSELETKASKAPTLPNETPPPAPPALDFGAVPSRNGQDQRRELARGTRCTVPSGYAEIWRDYLTHRPPPQSDRGVTETRRTVEKMAAARSLWFSKTVYVHVYRKQGQSEPVRFSVSDTDTPQWPKPKRGSVERLSAWRRGVQVSN